MKLSFPIFNRAAKAVKTSVVASIISVASHAVHIATANIWRDSYNPIRGLDMRRIVSLLEEGERGAYADLQWLYRFIEKRDATLRGGKRSLLSGVIEKGWKISGVPDEQLPDGATPQMRDTQIDRLRAQYDAIDNMRDAIEHLGLAEFRGYSHLEKHYFIGGPNDGLISHLETVPQWYMCRDGLNGEWQYNDGAVTGRTSGLSLDPANWIIREIDDPINEIALPSFARKGLSQKDYDGFIEGFGIPGTFIEMPQNVPPGKEAEYQAIAERITADARGVLPAGAKIHSTGGNNLGTPPFEAHLAYQDSQIVMAITSGLLTMLTASGSGTLAGGAHSDTFDRVVRALAKRISEVFQQQLDKAFLEENFPNQPALAYFEIKAEQETNTSEFVKDVVSLEGAGLEVDASQIEEQTGYRVLRKASAPAELPLDPQKKETGKLKNRRTGNADPVQSSGLADALGVKDSWVAPVADLWEELIAKIEDGSISDADLLAFLGESADRLPELFGKMDINALADVMEVSQGEAALEGVRAAIRTKKEISK